MNPIYTNSSLFSHLSPSICAKGKKLNLIKFFDQMSYGRRERYDSMSPPRRRRSFSRSYSSSRSRSRSSETDVINPGNNLYVTGLSPRISKRDLEDHFSKKGTVLECHLVIDPRTRESRGFGFVTMATIEDAERCIKYLDGSALEGRVITVEKAKRKRGRTPTPGKYLGIRPTRGRDYDRRAYSRSSDLYGSRRSPSYSPYRGRYRSPRYSPYGRDRSRSRSPYYNRRYASRSPYYSRRYASPSSYYSRRYASRSPYYGRRERSYSPDDRRRDRSYSPYERRDRRDKSYSPYDRRERSPYTRHYRSISPYDRRGRTSSRRERSVSRSVSPYRGY